MTQGTFVGRFASRDRLDEFRTLKITDILNVSDTQSQVTTIDGPFRTVTWVNIEDGKLIPPDDAIKAIDTIHRSLMHRGGRVYVHCMAGWNRSPTILWLYLIACGITSKESAQLFYPNAIDAVPGHPLLVDSRLIATVQKHGRDNFLPHLRPSAIEAL